MKLTKGKLSKILNRKKQSMRRYKNRRNYRRASKTFRRRKPLNLHRSSMKKMGDTENMGWVDWVGGVTDKDSSDNKVPEIVKSVDDEPPVVTEPEVVAADMPKDEEDKPVEIAPESEPAPPMEATEPVETAPEVESIEAASASEVEPVETLPPPIQSSTPVEDVEPVEPATGPAPAPEPELVDTAPAEDVEPVEPATGPAPAPEPELVDTAPAEETESVEAEPVEAKLVEAEPATKPTIQEAINIIVNELAQAVAIKLQNSDSGDNQDADQSIRIMSNKLEKSTGLAQSGGRRTRRRAKH